MRKAFTLVEVLVTSVILSFVLAGTATVIPLATKLSTQAINRSRLASYASGILNTITSDIRVGSAVNLATHNKIVIYDQGTPGAITIPIMCNYSIAPHQPSKFAKRDAANNISNIFRPIGFKNSVITCKFYDFKDPLSPGGADYTTTSIKVVVKVSVRDDKNNKTLTTEISNVVNCRNLSTI